MRNVAMPYLTLGDDEVTAGPWEYRAANARDWRALEDHVPKWDYATQFSVRRMVEISKDGLDRIFSGAPLGRQLAVVAGLRSGAARGSIALELERVAIEYAEPAAKLEVEIPSSVLSDRLLLQTQLVLLADIPYSPPLAPARMGCRIWQDEQSIRVSGLEARLPMELVSFKEQYRQVARAPWLVHWNPSEWDRDFMSAVVVMINDDATESRTAVMQSEPHALRQIMVDLVSDVVSGYLVTPELAASHEWPEGSLGHVVESWIDVLAGQDLARDQLRTWADDSTGMLRARVLHVFAGTGRVPEAD